MKKVSAKMFFTVMWRGLCQALGWFFGLFGYKRDGKFAKCVWGLFATSAAIVMGIIAFVFVQAMGDEVYRWYKREYYSCNNEDCWANTPIGRDLIFHNHEDGKGYIYNVRTGEKLLKNVEWIAQPTGKDSLVCFSDGKKRGYFSKNTGKIVVAPKYDHAWVFSDGLASVDDGGYIKFIDVTGNVVIDKNMSYIPNMEGYVFHGGYCVVCSEDGNRFGMMDQTGRMVLPMEYDFIYSFQDYTLWNPKKGSQEAMLDSELKEIIPMQECTIYSEGKTIDVTMPDHTMRKYDLQGQLIHDFYISSVRKLEYEKDEFVHYRRAARETDNEFIEEAEESFHPKATARLRAYVAGFGFEGLMTADGHVVTMPLYNDIEALDHDLYLCTSTNNDKVIVNGKGEIVK